MKTQREIQRIKALLPLHVSDDGGNGILQIKPTGESMLVVWSFGCGWDHVSVSYANRTPTWDEMCVVKDMFFRKDEVVVEYHPAADEYVNQHPHCLHLFRPQEETVPTPPYWMVGLKPGQKPKDAERDARAWIAAHGYAERS